MVVNLDLHRHESLIYPTVGCELSNFANVICESLTYIFVNLLPILFSLTMNLWSALSWIINLDSSVDYESFIYIKVNRESSLFTTVNLWIAPLWIFELHCGQFLTCFNVGYEALNFTAINFWLAPLWIFDFHCREFLIYIFLLIVNRQIAPKLVVKH